MAVRKRFGQHFLHDPGIIRRIVAAVAPVRGERIVEVGAGRGALTWSLLERARYLDVIEIDRDLARLLAADSRAPAHLRVHVENVLDTDFVRLRGDGPPLRIVGNLPYNISTPLLFHLLSQRTAITDMHFMLQREVVDRMAAKPGGKEYGRLTVMLAAYAEVEGLFDVGPGAFQPRPKVWSAVVRLRPSPEPRFAIGSDDELRAVVTAAFSHRRKTLRNGLKGLLSGEEIEACGIDPQMRPETLAPEQFGRLARHYRHLHEQRIRQSA
jgi:16S rRNA (adenine1518-N6/adenine1519-N6)-dimethyltransferase